MLQKNKIINYIIICLSGLLLILFLIILTKDYIFYKEIKNSKVKINYFCDYIPQSIEFNNQKKFGYSCSTYINGFIIPHVFDYARFFDNGYAIVAVKNSGRMKYGIINKLGITIIPFEYSHIGYFDGKTAVACHGSDYYNSYCGIIDKKNNFIISPTYPTYRLNELLKIKLNL